MNHRGIISPEQLLDELDNESLIIIDCRFSLNDTEEGRRAYQKGHIPGALYAHLDEDLSGPIVPGVTGRHPLPSIERMSQRIAQWGISESSQVVVYDQGHGGIAARLWWMLRWLGHEGVAVLDGGWAEWAAIGAPSSSEFVEPKPGVFQPGVKKDWLVEADEIAAHIQKPTFCLIDARVAVRYRGEEEPIDPIAGHIPTAVNLPFADNLGPDGRWLSAAVLRARFAPYVDGERPVVCYCGSGVTACHNLLALYLAGFEDGRLYAGSWSHWITLM